VGISLRLDFISGDPDRNDCRCGVAFGSFSEFSFPRFFFALDRAFVEGAAIRIGPMVLGNMDVGINTQNLVAMLLVIFFPS